MLFPRMAIPVAAVKVRKGMVGEGSADLTGVGACLAQYAGQVL